jgi:hypothetical protein
MWDDWYRAHRLELAINIPVAIVCVLIAIGLSLKAWLESRK